jgi:serine/threonine protein kinase
MKIESFMIDWDGYLNLMDLMYLQELKEDEFYIDTPSKATLYYLSPETLSGQGYGLESDFWALGVVIYRMAVG